MKIVLLAAAAALSFASLTAPVLAGPTWTDAEKAAKENPDFSLQGEYVGKMTRDGEEKTFGVQVVALGGGKFMAAGYAGGLPGAGSTERQPHKRVEAEMKDGKVVFADDAIQAVLSEAGMSMQTADGKEICKLEKVNRQSPTLGAKAPDGAVVLYGKPEDAANFEGGKASEDGTLMQGVTSKQKFADHTLHLEFCIPYQPEDRGQGRGNSGLYLQGRYEVQMLDSFGLEGLQNECGGIYSVAEPKVNMALPPLTWQTYDVDYTAAKYDADGKLTTNPRVTVKHNGVVIHDNVELPGERNTTAAPIGAGKEPGPVYLQNHGNPVRYRNIWAVEKK